MEKKLTLTDMGKNRHEKNRNESGINERLEMEKSRHGENRNE